MRLLVTAVLLDVAVTERYTLTILGRQEGLNGATGIYHQTLSGQVLSKWIANALSSMTNFRLSDKPRSRNKLQSQIFPLGLKTMVSPVCQWH